MTNLQRKAQSFARCFFLAGIFTCTWDRIATIDLSGFTIKLHQFMFLFSLVAILFAKKGQRPLEGLMRLPIGFALPICALAGYYFIGAPFSHFPLKSALYSCWILFNLGTIWLSAILLSSSLGKEHLSQFVLVTMAFLSAIVFFDHLAYQFGYKSGLIGFNQDEILQWGVSRPHAFSFEPSYIASFLCLSLVLSYSKLRKYWPRKNLVSWGAVTLGLFAIFAAASRTGWVSLLAGLLLFLVLDSFSRKRLPWKQLILLFTLSVLAWITYYSITPKIQENTLVDSLVTSVYKGTDGSGNARIRAHLYAWQMAKNTNLLGTGLGASYVYWTNKEKNDPGAKLSAEHFGSEVVMSTWGQLLAEGGLPALFLFGSAAFFLVRSLWLQWKKSGDRLVLGSLCSAIVFFTFIAFWLGNVARGDVWVWYAIWSRMALSDAGAGSAVVEGPPEHQA